MNEHRKGIKEFYDATASAWADKWYEDETMLPLLRQFAALLPENPRILDAGCGAGYESKRLAGLGARVVGIDFSEESIRIAREKTPECEFHVCDVKRIDPSLGRFDGIAAIALLVHFSEEAIPLVFDRFYERLHDGGYLFIAFVEGEGFNEKRSYTEVDGEKYNRAFYLHRPEKMVELARCAGFGDAEAWSLEDMAGAWRYLVFRKGGI